MSAGSIVEPAEPAWPPREPAGITGAPVTFEDVRLLLDSVHELAGLDFRGYAYSSIRRRIARAILETDTGSIAGLHQRIKESPATLQRLKLLLTVHTTSLFRDPPFFKALRETVIPTLRTYPFIRIWVAGCSTGEEVYSMAILLHEEDLASRCRIYATDLSEDVLDRAKGGVYPLAAMQDYSRNYQLAGGKGSLSDYYTADSSSAIFRRNLREGVVFGTHNLASDASFNEFHLILCRNVLIYFQRDLQHRVHALFYDSLIGYGYLALGKSETIRFSPKEFAYNTVNKSLRLYRENPMIVIGGSLGSYAALGQILPKLPSDLSLPIAIAVHRHKESHELLGGLRNESNLPIIEVDDKEPILPSRIYLCPADYHLLIDDGCFSLSTDDLVSFARPSIDVLFESAAEWLGPRVIGVILSGAGSDGAMGAKAIAAKGGTVIVQDPTSAEGPWMPTAAIAATLSSEVRRPAAIARRLVELAAGARTLA